MEEEAATHGEGGGLFLYLPDHVTLDLMARLSLWGSAERGLYIELTVTNVTNDVYEIAKESEFTPIQFAPRRAAIGQVRLEF